jgi:hypothetical protein
MKHSSGLLLCLCLAGIFALTGCGISSSVNLESSGSGTGEILISLDPLIVTYLAKELDLKQEEVFDLLKQYLLAEEFPVDNLAIVPDMKTSTARITFNFTSLKPLADSLKDQDKSQAAFTYSESNGRKTIRVLVTKDSLFSIPENILAFLYNEDPNPRLWKTFQEKFASQAGKQRAEALMSSSYLKLSFTGKAGIISQKGGVQKGNTVTFTFTLAELSSLSTPRELEVVCR